MTAPGSVIRLFVSSTFADFGVERDILQRVVFPHLRQVCGERGFRFQPIDLRWGVSQEAGNEKRTLAICFEEIRRCQQLSPDLNFLVLLGDRYGSCFLPRSIPSAQVARLLPRLDSRERRQFEDAYREDRNALPAEYVLVSSAPGARDEERLRATLQRAARAARFTDGEMLPFVASATHLEIHHGLLAPDTPPQATLCAFRAFAEKPKGHASAAFVERDRQRRARLDSLKRSIENRLGGKVLRYTVPWQKGDPTRDYAGFTQPVLEMLEARIRAVIAQRRRATQRRDGVSSVNERFAAERTRVIAGRDHELAQIAAYLCAATPLPLIVTGVSGVGKSSLLAQAVADATRAHPDAVIVARYIGITPGAGNQIDLLNDLRREIAGRYGRVPPPPTTDLSQLTSAFARELKTLEVAQEHPLFLVVDAVDQLGGHSERFDWVPRALAAHIRMIVATLLDRTGRADPLSWIPKEQFLVLGPLTREQGGDVLRQWLKEEGRQLQPFQEDAVLAGFAPEGNPLYLRLASEEARVWQSFTPVAALPSSTAKLLRRVFDRLAEDRQHGPRLVMHALGDLAAARNGLAEGELLDILGRDPQVAADLHRLNPAAPELDPALPLPVVLWARLHADLERYLTEREVDGTELVTFYHQQVRDVVNHLYVSGPDGDARHQDLATYFGRQPYRQGEIGWNRRKLAEVAFQQARMGPAGEKSLTETLTDARFLEGKLMVEGANETLADLKSLRQDTAVRQIAWVVRGWASELEANPDEITNQMDGRVGAPRHLHHTPWEEGKPYVHLMHPTLLGDPALLRVLRGHTNEVLGCAFSADGALALSGSRDGTLRVWEVATGRETQAFVTSPDRFSQMECLAFSCDGQRALTGYWNVGAPRLWDLQSGNEVRPLEGHGTGVSGCVFSPDGRLALAASWDHPLVLWDVASGREVRVLEDHADLIWPCAFSPDGRLALSAAADHSLRLWEVETGQELSRLEGHTESVLGCAFSPDGRFALSASADNTLRLWGVASGRAPHATGGHLGSVPEGRRLWGVASGQALYVFEGHDGVGACAFSPDGRLVLAACGDRTLRLWNLVTGREMRAFRGHRDSVLSCAFSPDGRTIVSASKDHTLRLWEVAIAHGEGEITDREDLPKQAGHSDAVYGCALTPDGRLALSSSRDGTLRLWEVTSGQEIRAFGQTEKQRRPYWRAEAKWTGALTADARLALSGGLDGTLRLWEVSSGLELRVFRGHRDAVYGCAFSADGRLALSASHDHTLRLWDVASGEAMRTFEGHTDSVTACAFSPNGRMFLSSSRDGTLRLWEVAGGEAVAVCRGHRDWVLGCAFSPDGRLAVSASADQTVKVWEVASGREIRAFRGHRGWVRGCAFSADGRLVLSASDDGTLRVWARDAGREVARWQHDAPLLCCGAVADTLFAVAGDQLGGVHFLELLGPENLLRLFARAGAGAPLAPEERQVRVTVDGGGVRAQGTSNTPIATDASGKPPASRAAVRPRGKPGWWPPRRRADHH